MIQRIKAIFTNFYELRRYIVTAALIFIVGMFIGVKMTSFHDYLNSQVAALGDVAAQLSEMDNSSFWIFLFIFLNNTIKSILIIFLGAFFGLLPIAFLLLNGMVLGYVYVLFMEQGESIWRLIIGILPHGIIELPVVIIACAYGIKFGSIVLKKLIPWVVSKDKRKEGEMFTFLKNTLPLMVFLTVTLFISAVIEATVTRWLLGG